eukprot:TRINITY_DN298_c2_g3_i1.p2 TRINITY_DN298_c2_g3~~TRINITY_DN298_c2_g3_i1.p2  ORF type:complete len:281 (-),score=151.50 TRINITY_DN298_c2_g3_i1:64-906(-)
MVSSNLNLTRTLPRHGGDPSCPARTVELSLNGTATSMRTFNTQRRDPERDPVRDRHGLAELTKVRATLRAECGDAANALVRFFARADTDGSGTVSRAELRACLSGLGVALAPRQWQALLDEFDPDGDGIVSQSEFLRAVVGQMGLRRRALVVDAFEVLGGARDRPVPLDAVVARYDPSGHPDVVRGARDAAQLRAELRETFAVVGDGDESITLDEFVEYHANMSCAVYDEAGFERFVRTAWGMGSGTAAVANTASFGIVDDPRNPYETQRGYGGAMPRVQ